MGTVYLADDPRLGRQVALKVPRFDPARAAEASERFRREARAAGAVRHPNLCPVYDVGRLDGVDYLTMPHVAGESLAARLRGTARCPAGRRPGWSADRRGDGGGPPARGWSTAT